MQAVPSNIGRARVLLYSPLDCRHRRTGGCKHTVGNVVNPPIAGLAICEYQEEKNSYYLFYCDESWKEITDTWHPTLNDAKQQAEFEFEGVSNTWEEVQTIAK